jgi:hypothetical protein
LSFLDSQPRTASWAKFSRPCGTEVMCRLLAAEVRFSRSTWQRQISSRLWSSAKPTNLILFGPTLLKTINKLQRQKPLGSANLDSSGLD